MTATRTAPHIDAPAPLYAITLATIEGDKTTFSTAYATTHAQALQNARENTSATIRAYYTPHGETLPLAAMHVTACTLSGIASRGTALVNGTLDAPFSPRQQQQLALARHTLHKIARFGAEAIAIPHAIADFHQVAALALVNHIAPLATVQPRDIQEAYRASMCAVQKAFRADTRGVQQAEAGKELPRMYGSPTMRKSTPHRPAPRAYHDAIAAIRQALPSEQARAVLDAWKEHPEATIRDLAEYVNGKKSPTARHVARIKEIALALYPDGIPTR